MQNAVFEVGLSKRGVNLVDFWDLDKLRNDAVLSQLSFPPLAQLILLTSGWWCGLISFVFGIDLLEVDQISAIGYVLITSLDVVVYVCLIVQLSGIKLLALWLFFILMNKREPNIIFKFSYCEVELHICEFRVFVKLLKYAFGKSTNYWFLVVSNHIREELIYKFDLEICQVEASVVITVKLVR